MSKQKHGTEVFDMQNPYMAAFQAWGCRLEFAARLKPKWYNGTPQIPGWIKRCLDSGYTFCFRVSSNKVTNYTSEVYNKDLKAHFAERSRISMEDSFKKLEETIRGSELLRVPDESVDEGRDLPERGPALHRAEDSGPQA